MQFNNPSSTKNKNKNDDNYTLKKTMCRSPLRRGFRVALLALACFALSPTSWAVSPAPDGGYPNQNTAEGDAALNSLTTGNANTAIGFAALFSNTTGFANTAVGGFALYNTTGAPIRQPAGRR